MMFCLIAEVGSLVSWEYSGIVLTTDSAATDDNIEEENDENDELLPDVVEGRAYQTMIQSCCYWKLSVHNL